MSDNILSGQTRVVYASLTVHVVITCKITLLIGTFTPKVP